MVDSVSIHGDDEEKEEENEANRRQKEKGGGKGTGVTSPSSLRQSWRPPNVCRTATSVTAPARAWEEGKAMPHLSLARLLACSLARSLANNNSRTESTTTKVEAQAQKGGGDSAGEGAGGRGCGGHGSAIRLLPCTAA